MKGLHWANIGLQQFHLPVGEPEEDTQVVRGEIGLAFTSEQLTCLRARLENAGTAHELEADGSLLVTCPVGNKLRLVEWPGRATWFGPSDPLDPSREKPLPGGASAGLGMQYVRFRVPVGAAAGICRFYDAVFGATVAEVRHEGARSVCVVHIGHHQSLAFEELVEGEPPLPPYDGHHVALYTNDFEGVYERSAAAGVVWSNPRFPHLTYETLGDALRHNEFRLRELVDPQTGEVLYTLEHEVRSVLHPGFSCRHWLVPPEGAANEAMVGEYPTAKMEEEV